MKSFLRDIYIEPFSYNDWIGYVIGIITWLISLIIIAGLLCLSIWLIDSSFMPMKEKEGKVTSKFIIPAYSTITFVTSGEIMIPVTTYYDTSYNLVIAIDGLKDDISVYEDYYNAVYIGQKIHCKYTNGRIKSSLYIKELN